MAQKLYGSTGGLSNEVIKMYGSVGGLSKNIVKGYCSESGLSKLFFGDGGGGGTISFPRLNLAYNYQEGGTYVVERASIRDTVKYALEKTIYISYHSSAKTLLQTLKTKINEILNYVDSQASGYNQCIASIQDISNTSMTIVVYLGNSSLSNITINTVYQNYNYYPMYYTNNATEKTSIYCYITLQMDGTMTMNTYQNTSSYLSRVIGQVINYNSSYPTISYVLQVSNLGVRFDKVSTSTLLADWDFTESSLDKIDGLSAQSDGFGGRIPTIYADGIHLTQTYYPLYVAPWILKYCNGFEVVIGDISETTQYGTALLNSYEFNLGFDANNNKWVFTQHSLSLSEDVGVTDKTFIANSTIKVTFDTDGYPSLYKDDVLIHKCSVVKLDRDKIYGSVMSILTGYVCSISSLKFYIDEPIPPVPPSQKYTLIYHGTFVDSPSGTSTSNKVTGYNLNTFYNNGYWGSNNLLLVNSTGDTSRWYWTGASFEQLLGSQYGIAIPLKERLYNPTKITINAKIQQVNVERQKFYINAIYYDGTSVNNSQAQKIPFTLYDEFERIEIDISNRPYADYVYFDFSNGAYNNGAIFITYLTIE